MDLSLTDQKQYDSKQTDSDCLQGDPRTHQLVSVLPIEIATARHAYYASNQYA